MNKLYFFTEENPQDIELMSYNLVFGLKKRVNNRLIVSYYGVTQEDMVKLTPQYMCELFGKIVDRLNEEEVKSKK